MLRLFTQLVPAVIATTMLIAASAPSKIVPMREKCRGTITSVVPGHLTFAGIGQAAHFGKYSVLGGADFDMAGNVLNGEFTSTVADGSTISGVFSGTYTPLQSGQIQFNVLLTWLSGTGRLAGVTGEADVVALLDGLAPGAAFQYEGLGHLVLP